MAKTNGLDAVFLDDLTAKFSLFAGGSMTTFEEMTEADRHPGTAEMAVLPSERYLRLHRSFESAKAIEHVGRVQESIAIVHRAVDDMFRDERFDEVDQLLGHVDVGGESVDMLLSLLTATSVARGRLPSRPAFYRQVEELLRARGVLEAGLLDGLQ